MNDESVKEFDQGSFGEGPWQLVNDCSVIGYTEGVAPCHHCHSPVQHPDFKQWWQWTCPAVIRSYNQGGHDNTMVCLACVWEQTPVEAMTWAAPGVSR